MKSQIEIQDRILTDDEIFEMVANEFNVPKKIVRGAYYGWWQDMAENLRTTGGTFESHVVKIPHFGHLIPR